MTALLYTRVASPLGPLLVAGDETALHVVRFPSGRKAFGPEPSWRRADVPFREAERQLEAYFGGELRGFELPLHLTGTAFQKSVWTRLATIPFGATTTYGELARALGSPKASRAVGLANGSNPLPIILPCHRVVGADGSLTGFGGGLEAKALLLAHEARVGGCGAQLRLI